MMKTWTALNVLCIAGLTMTVSMSRAKAENWPRFRGPNGQGLSTSQDIPVKWSDGDVAWTLELAGEGHSSPVIQDGIVFITFANKTAAPCTLMAVALTNGSVLWQQNLEVKPVRMNGLNSLAASTPATDSQGVYTVWYGADQTLLVAFDLQGKKRWTRDLGPTETQHGPASSPIVEGDRVILAVEQGANGRGLQSCWYAVDARSGEDRWRLERPGNSGASASTPCVHHSKNGKRTLIFTSQDHGITAVNPDDGSVVWEQHDAMPARVVSSPVLAEDLILGTCGRGGSGVQLTAVRVPNKATSPPITVHAIQERHVPYVPTSIVTQGRLFAFHDLGAVSCLDLTTGAVLWSEKPGGNFYGSPVLADDRLYCINRKGQVVVLRASDTYELLAVNDLGEPSQSTPAVANGRMILRTVSHLYCVSAKRNP